MHWSDKAQSLLVIDRSETNSVEIEWKSLIVSCPAEKKWSNDWLLIWLEIYFIGIDWWIISDEMIGRKDVRTSVRQNDSRSGRQYVRTTVRQYDSVYWLVVKSNFSIESFQCCITPNHSIRINTNIFNKVLNHFCVRTFHQIFFEINFYQTHQMNNDV